MAFRRVTEAEFDYIKELIKKYRGNLKKVAGLVGRSYSLMTYVVKADTFKEYCQIRPGGKKYKAEKKEKTRKSENKRVHYKYQLSKDSEAILTELQNVRKATFAVCSELKRLSNPKIVMAQTLPLPEFESKPEKKRNHPVLDFIIGLMIVVLVIWAIVTFL